jgi:hypothetical protein
VAQDRSSHASRSGLHHLAQSHLQIKRLTYRNAIREGQSHQI